MDAQRIAVDAVVAMTDCDREQVAAFIRRLYLTGVKDPKRRTFKGPQAMARGLKTDRHAANSTIRTRMGGTPFPEKRGISVVSW